MRVVAVLALVSIALLVGYVVSRDVGSRGGALVPVLDASAAPEHEVESTVLAAEADRQPVQPAEESEAPSAPTIVVRDPEGKSVANMKVALFVADEEDGADNLGSPASTWRSDAEGHVLGYESPRTRSHEIHWLATVVPLAERRPIAVSPKWDTELVVPAPWTAPLRVVVETPEGEPWQGRGRVVLHPTIDAGLSPYYERFEGAELLLPHVRTDVPFVLELDSIRRSAPLEAFDPVQVNVPALSRDEETRCVVVVLRDQNVVANARFVDEAGEPLAGVQVRVRSPGSASRCDEDGRASIALRGLVGRAEPWTGEVKATHANGSFELHGRIELPAQLRGGPIDVGDVVLRPVPCLVSGRFVRADGAPLAFRWLDVVGRDPGEPWRILKEEGGMTGKDGSFLWPESAATRRYPSELALDLSRRGSTLLPNAVRFEAGQQDLEVVVEPSDTVFGKIQWTGTGEMPELDLVEVRDVGLNRRTPIEKPGAFRASAPLDGAVELRLTARGSNEELTAPRRFEVTGEAETWDIGPGIRELLYTIEADRERNVQISYRTEETGPFPFPAARRRDGSYRIVTRADRIDVEVRFRSHFLNGPTARVFRNALVGQHLVIDEGFEAEADLERR